LGRSWRFGARPDARARRWSKTLISPAKLTVEATPEEFDTVYQVYQIPGGKLVSKKTKR
jgi:predicted metalloendopeptidase